MRKLILLLAAFLPLTSYAQTLTLGQDSVYINQRAVIDVLFNPHGQQDITAWEAVILYDTTLHLAGVFDDDLIGEGVVVNSGGDKIRMAWASAYPIDSAGILVQIAFDTDTTTTTGHYPVWFESAMLNEGNGVSTFDGGVTVEDSILLSVEASPLRADVIHETISLSWETFSEISNAGFYIQQVSHIDNEWMGIDFVEATGSPSEYRWSRSFPPGNYELRYLQVDYDGLGWPSRSVTVTVADPIIEGVAIYPNPTPDFINIRVAVRSHESVTVEAFDALGKRVTQDIDFVATGVTVERLSLEAFPSGLYFIRVTAGREVSVTPITVKK